MLCRTILIFRTQETMSDVEKSIFYFKCIDIYDRLLIDHHVCLFCSCLSIRSTLFNYPTFSYAYCILLALIMIFRVCFEEWNWCLVSCFRFLPDIATLSTECQQWILNVAKTAPAHPGIALLYEQHDVYNEYIENEGE